MFFFFIVCRNRRVTVSQTILFKSKKMTKPIGRNSDGELIDRIALGDQTAFAELYDRHKGMIYGLALSMLGDGPTAEEVTMSVFTLVWRHAGQFRPEIASVKTWMASTARHRAIDVLRRRRSHDLRPLPAWAEVDPDALSAPGRLDTEVEEHELLRIVRTAISELSPELKEVLALAYFKGQSHSEIAETLQQPLGTVKTRIRSAMQQLRVRLRHVV